MVFNILVDNTDDHERTTPCWLWTCTGMAA
jgi:hypothetical protein